MDRYKYMFNNCRIPKKPSDVNAMYDPKRNTHIVVIRKNRFYVVDTVYQGRPLTTGEFEYQFQRIIDAAGYTKGPALGVLTADHRDLWTDVSLAVGGAGEGCLERKPMLYYCDYAAES